MVNVGYGLGYVFMQQDFVQVCYVIDINIIGIIDFIQQIGQGMLQCCVGCVFVMGFIVGLMLGSFQVVYNGIKVFIDFFCYVLCNELKDIGVIVICLMLGVIDIEFFE